MASPQLTAALSEDAKGNPRTRKVGYVGGVCLLFKYNYDTPLPVSAVYVNLHIIFSLHKPTLQRNQRGSGNRVTESVVTLETSALHFRSTGCIARAGVTVMQLRKGRAGFRNLIRRL